MASAIPVSFDTNKPAAPDKEQAPKPAPTPVPVTGHNATRQDH